MAFLIIESGPEAGRRVDLGGALVIGRQSRSGLTIQDPKASREHTRLEPAAGAWAVVDLESRNGTMLNGRKIQREFLAAGDRITIGQTVLRFELADATPSATTRPMPEPGVAGAARPATTPILRTSPVAPPPPPPAVPIPPPPARPAPVAEADKAPKLRYQDKGQGVGVVTVLACLAILVGLVFAARWIAQRTITKVMNERKAEQAK
ncbi:MAG: FHA domain-containing protein [Planctomycetes bacterium]|nr:FHA domain-containing protein [Planctomycetota bacterium]